MEALIILFAEFLLAPIAIVFTCFVNAMVGLLNILFELAGVLCGC